MDFDIKAAREEFKKVKERTRELERLISAYELACYHDYQIEEMTIPGYVHPEGYGGADWRPPMYIEPKIQLVKTCSKCGKSQIIS